MHEFKYVNGRLACENVSVDALARAHGTPLYVYSQGTLTRHFQRLDEAWAAVPHGICFAVKSNSNLAVLRVLANLGSGFDVVSEGELRRVCAAGGSPGTCIFAGVGKTQAEIDYALNQDIYAFNVESEAELERIDRLAARRGKAAPVALRVNPNVDALTHAKITTGTYLNKFGIPLEEIRGLAARARRLKHVRVRGLQMHIGSQISEVKPFAAAARKVVPLIRELQKDHPLEFFSVGGGLGIVYEAALESGAEAWWESAAARQQLTAVHYAADLAPMLEPLGLRILLEPGRFIAGNAGILVTRVEYVKRMGSKTFVIVDAAMNDLVRPAFYDAYHEIVPVAVRNGAMVTCDVVGPVCESSDYFARNRRMPRVQEGDLLAVMSAGAYGFSMASNYNTRPLPAEVLVHGRLTAVARFRQYLPRIWEAEKLPRWLKFQRLPPAHP